MKKIPLSKYAILNKEDRLPYDFAISNTKGRKSIEVLSYGKWLSVSPKYVDIWDYRWSEMIELKEAVVNSDVERIAMIVYGVSEFTRINVIDAFTSFKWVMEGITEVLKIEKQELSSQLSDRERRAGIEKLYRFGEQTNILSLMEALRLTEQEVLSLPYHKVFMMLCYQKTINEIQKSQINDSNEV